MSEPTSQQKIKALLAGVGLPYKKIDVYGGQIVITSYSEKTAIAWSGVLAKFATVKRAALKSVDEAKEQKGTCLCRTYVPVWLTYATIV